MAYIEPNTKIVILQNVPLDNGYKHTIYFETPQAQRDFFTSKRKYVLDNQSYQRKERGYMRVQLKAENLYNCNYLMFQNTSFGDRWFYAFITSVEYVNNEVSEIGFEIDVMQTWFFDVTMLDSYVEREHSTTDEAGDNLIDEPFKCDDMFTSPMTKATDVNGNKLFDEYSCILVSPYKRHEYGSGIVQVAWLPPSPDPPSIPVDPALPPSVDNQIQGVFYTVLHDEEAIARAIKELTDSVGNAGKINDVITLYPVPKYFVYPRYNNFDVLDGVITAFSVSYGEKPTRLGNYLPRNKKLLTYPFNKFVLDNGTGMLNEYPYEYFNENIVRFQIFGNILQNVSFKAIPFDYKGSGSETANRSYPTLLNDFPLTSFSADAFKAWLAQNKSSVALQTAGALGALYPGALSGLGMVQAGSQMLTPVRKQISKAGGEMMAEGYAKVNKASVAGALGLGAILTNIITKSQAPMEVKGTTDGCLEMRMGTKDFNGVQYYLNPSDARMIDDFFSTYGYATKRVKKPNRNVREHWTYTKTIDCNIEGNAPADDVNKICSIYDSGITFWNDGNSVGMYLDNDGNFKANLPL